MSGGAWGRGGARTGYVPGHVCNRIPAPGNTRQQVSRATRSPRHRVKSTTKQPAKTNKPIVADKVESTASSTPCRPPPDPSTPSLSCDTKNILAMMSTCDKPPTPPRPLLPSCRLLTFFLLRISFFRDSLSAFASRATARTRSSSSCLTLFSSSTA